MLAAKGTGAALSALSKTKAGAEFLARLGKIADKTGELANLGKAKLAAAFSDNAASLAKNRLLSGNKLYAVLPGVPLSPEVIADFSVIIGNKVSKGMTSFRHIVEEMTTELGDAVKPHLDKLAQSYREAMKKAALKADENEIITIFKEWEVERAKNINDSIKISDVSEITGKGYANRQALRQKIGQADFPNYPKHIEAKTIDDAKKFSINGESQFLPSLHNKLKGIYREAIENAMNNGLVMKDGGKWYFFHKFENPVGYNKRKEARWIRVELTDNKSPDIHGHPTTLEVVRKHFPAIKGEK